MDTAQQIGNATLYLGDGRELPEQSFDALLTDPPYGCNYRSHHNTRHLDPHNAWTRYRRSENFAPIAGDDAPFDPQPWLDRAGKRPLVLWGANYYADRLPANGWLADLGQARGHAAQRSGGL